MRHSGSRGGPRYIETKNINHRTIRRFSSDRLGAPAGKVAGKLPPEIRPGTSARATPPPKQDTPMHTSNTSTRRHRRQSPAKYPVTPLICPQNMPTPPPTSLKRPPKHTDTPPLAEKPTFPSIPPTNNLKPPTKCADERVRLGSTGGRNTEQQHGYEQWDEWAARSARGDPRYSGS